MTYQKVLPQYLVYELKKNHKTPEQGVQDLLKL